MFLPLQQKQVLSINWIKDFILKRGGSHQTNSLGGILIFTTSVLMLEGLGRVYSPRELVLVKFKLFLFHCFIQKAEELNRRIKICTVLLQMHRLQCKSKSRDFI